MYLKFKKITEFREDKNSLKILIELEDGKNYTLSIEEENSLDLDLVLKAQKNEIKLNCLTNSDEIVFLIEIWDEEDFCAYDFKELYIDSINKRKKPVALGFPTIDKAIGGLWQGHTYLIGAPSGHAKTIMLINFCKKVCDDLNKKSAYIDLELGRHILMDRFAGILSQFNVRKHVGQMEDSKKYVLRQSLDKRILKNLFISDLSNRRLYYKQLEKKMNKYLEKGVEVFFIDYAQNIFPDIKSERKQELTETSYALRMFAKKHEVSIFIATQLNRGSTICDIKEFNHERVSDAIELVNDRDFMINARNYQTDKEHNKGVLECFIAKNRFGERLPFFLKFKEWTGLLEECPEPSELSPEEAQNIKAPVSFFSQDIPNKFGDKL